MPKTWIYKNNSRTGGGDWDGFFDDPDDGEWGDCEPGDNSPRATVMRRELGWRDQIIAYQSNRKEAVGLCQFLGRFTARDGAVGVFFKPLRRFAEPVPLDALQLAAPSAFRQGDVRSFYDLSPTEAASVLDFCERFGSTEDEQDAELDEPLTHLDDMTALFSIERHLRLAGWNVTVVGRREHPFDIAATRAAESAHILVKAARDHRLVIAIDDDEYEHLRSAAAAKLTVVTEPFAEPPEFEEFSGQEALNRLEFVPTAYNARRRA